LGTRPEDVIIGKLMAWAEGRSRKHETDIFEMLVFHYLGIDLSQSTSFEESYVDTQAKELGQEVAEFWKTIKQAAREKATQAK
jgi:hypothetical protein